MIPNIFIIFGIFLIVLFIVTNKLSRDKHIAGIINDDDLISRMDLTHTENSIVHALRGRCSMTEICHMYKIDFWQYRKNLNRIIFKAKIQTSK